MTSVRTFEERMQQKQKHKRKHNRNNYLSNEDELELSLEADREYDDLNKPLLDNDGIPYIPILNSGVPVIAEHHSFNTDVNASDETSETEEEEDLIERDTSINDMYNVSRIPETTTVFNDLDYLWQLSDYEKWICPFLVKETKLFSFEEYETPPVIYQNYEIPIRCRMDMPSMLIGSVTYQELIQDLANEIYLCTQRKLINEPTCKPTQIYCYNLLTRNFFDNWEFEELVELAAGYLAQRIQGKTHGCKILPSYTTQNSTKQIYLNAIIEIVFLYSAKLIISHNDTINCVSFNNRNNKTELPLDEYTSRFQTLTLFIKNMIGSGGLSLNIPNRYINRLHLQYLLRLNRIDDVSNYISNLDHRVDLMLKNEFGSHGGDDRIPNNGLILINAPFKDSDRLNPMLYITNPEFMYVLPSGNEPHAFNTYGMDYGVGFSYTETTIIPYVEVDPEDDYVNVEIEHEPKLKPAVEYRLDEYIEQLEQDDPDTPKPKEPQMAITHNNDPSVITPDVKTEETLSAPKPAIIESVHWTSDDSSLKDKEVTKTTINDVDEINKIIETQVQKHISSLKEELERFVKRNEILEKQLKALYSYITKTITPKTTTPAPKQETPRNTRVFKCDRDGRAKLHDRTLSDTDTYIAPSLSEEQIFERGLRENRTLMESVRSEDFKISVEDWLKTSGPWYYIAQYVSDTKRPIITVYDTYNNIIPHENVNHSVNYIVSMHENMITSVRPNVRNIGERIFSMDELAGVEERIGLDAYGVINSENPQQNISKFRANHVNQPHLLKRLREQQDMLVQLSKNDSLKNYSNIIARVFKHQMQR